MVHGPVFYIAQWPALVCKEVEDIPTAGRFTAIELCISAVRTANGNELFILHIEYFCKIAAGRLELVVYILCAAALWADVSPILVHRASPFQIQYRSLIHI